MNFDDAKENIKPLASGRNASILTNSLTYHSDLQKQREMLESAIKNYEGDDPLEPWYDYILWIEQSYPSGGNEGGLKKVLLKCLTTFEDDKKYYQDRRMIRIFIKYIDTEENPIELYQELFNCGIGTMISDLYICWAYYYDLAGNFQKADSIFRKGLELKAQPYDELEEAHRHFGFTMSQRILHQDETSKEEFITSMRERRHALTSLRPHKKKVGSIRTGSVVKSLNPGKIKIGDENSTASNCQNIKVQVFEDQNKDPNSHLALANSEEHHIPVVKNIIDSVRKQENLKEPGPWTKGMKKRGHLFDNTKSHEHEIGFTILEDDKETESENIVNNLPKLPEHPNNYPKGILLPQNFARKNYPQGIWRVDCVADSEIQPHTFPQYNKLFHYPKPDVEFSTEEVLAYKWFMRHGKQNTFTEMCKNYFGNEVNVGIRMYKNFSKRNLPEKENNFKLSEFIPQIPANAKLVIKINEIYCGIDSGTIHEEKQLEEVLFEKIKSGKRKIKFDANETITIEEGMDETQCFTNIVGRKSIFPSRKSMAPFSERKTIFKPPNSIILEEERSEAVGFDIRESENRKSVIAENVSYTLSSHIEEKILDDRNSCQSGVPTEICFPKIFKNITDNPLKDIPISNPIQSHILNEKNETIKINVSETAEGSINPIQITEKSNLCSVNENNKKEIEKEKDKNLDNFVIYEDPEESFKFKQPHPIKNVLQPKIQLPAVEEECDDNAGLKPAQNQIFAVDETFSTQNFNLFIKAQPTSTPIGKKREIINHIKDPVDEKFQDLLRKSITNNPIDATEPAQDLKDRSDHSNLLVASRESIDLPISNQLSNERIVLNTSPIIPEPQIYKQLSTIMETSETLAAASTKSSVDTQGTLANDLENIKCAETKNKSQCKSAHKSKTNVSENLSTSKCFDGMQQEIGSTTDENIVCQSTSKGCTKKEIGTIKRKSVITRQYNVTELDNEEIAQKNLITTQNFEKPDKSIQHSLASLKIDEADKLSKKFNNDASQYFKMNSIQIFEEKTETVPKIILKKPIDFEEQSPTDLYDFFAKTPEKKCAMPAIYNTASKTKFEINDSLTFSKLNEITLPKFSDNNKFVMKDSPASKIAKLSFVKENNEKVPVSQACSLSKSKFEDHLPILPDLKDLTLPKLPDKDLNNSFERRAVKLSFLSREIIGNDIKTESHKLNPEFDDFKTSDDVPQAIRHENSTIEKARTNFPSVFEDNTQTGAFALHTSSIKNSTLLPQKFLHMQNVVQEESIHLKEEILDNTLPKQNLKQLEVFSRIDIEHSSYTKISNYSENIDIDKKNKTVNAFPCTQMNSLAITDSENCFEIRGASQQSEDFDYMGRSIYSKFSFKTPIATKHCWVDADDKYQQEDFIHFNPENLDQTNIIINEKILDAKINPFSSELTHAFLESIEFTSHLQELDSCDLRGKINKLAPGDDINIKNKIFTVSKIIGEGAFGTIYSAKDKSSGKIYAMKQEKPANLWEYYICLELRSRLENINLLPAFMNIEYALIGNNASIFVSQFSPYGSFITLCNAYKRNTNKTLDEYVVMILTDQILQIVDHLHALKIIHADIKPDNFLLMTKLSYPYNQLAIQLIDFGVSIDMELFPKNQKFIYSHVKDDFKCIEMREGRPWTFQTDLYGVAGTIHVLLYGKYMDIQKNLAGIWVPKQRIPRYFKKEVWEPIFQSLLNVIDFNLMSNLQNLRARIAEQLLDKEKYVNEKVHEFNLCINNKL